MKRTILVFALAAIPSIGTCGGLDKFLKALDEAAQQTQQPSGGGNLQEIGSGTAKIPDICIGDLCLGDDITALDERLDSSQVEIVRSAQDVYKSEYIACEKDRPSKLAEAKSAQNQELNRAKSTTNQYVRQNANMRAGMLGVTVDLYSTNQVCIDHAKKAAENYAAPIVERQGEIRNFIVAWGATDKAVEPNEIIGAHPEAVVVAKTNAVGKGGGVLVFSARSNVGSYKDLTVLGTACQPIAIQGSVDGGKTKFISLNDPESGAFKVVAINTTFSGLTPDQVSSVVQQYWGKFGKYAAANTYPANQQSGFQLVFLNETNSSVSVTAIHPALSEFDYARNITSESPGGKMKGQFAGIGQAEFVREKSFDRFSPYEFSISPVAQTPIEFTKFPRCKIGNFQGSCRKKHYAAFFISGAFSRSGLSHTVSGSDQSRMLSLHRPGFLSRAA